jgi:hypothetical protein
MMLAFQVELVVVLVTVVMGVVGYLIDRNIERQAHRGDRQ